jgi:hypothetical protein
VANTPITPSAATANLGTNPPTQALALFTPGPPSVPAAPPAVNLTPLTGRVSLSGFRAPVPVTIKVPHSEALARAYYARFVGTIFDSPPAASFGVENAAAVLFDDILPDAQQPVIDVSSRLNHSVQVLGLAPGQVLKVQGSMDGATYATLSSGFDALSTNGLMQWVGLVKFLKASRVSGAGGQAQILLMSRM